MPNVTDPGKKKKVKIKYTKVGKAPDRSTDGVTLSHERGKETKKYTPADVRTGHKEYGKESKTNPTPGFVKRAQSAQEDIVRKDNKPYRAGHTETTRTPDKIHAHVKITPDLRRVHSTYTHHDDTKAKEGSSGKKAKLKPMRVVAGGSDKKDNPANKTGVGKKSGIKIRMVKSFKKR
jgi:hypothetical protein